MLGKTHFMGGVAAGTILGTALHVSPSTLALSAVVAGFGGLFSDIDKKGSTIGQLTGVFGTIVSKIFKHRGVLHTPLFWLIPYGVFLGFRIWNSEPFPLLVTSFVCGVMSHLLLDVINPAGLMIFWPFSKKRVHLLPIRAGGKWNTPIWILCFIISVAAVWEYLH